jgi:hypothetical protein
MGDKYLIDTNIAIHFLNGDLPENALKVVEPAMTSECNLSVISRIEVLAWQFPDEDKLRQAEKFLFASKVYRMTDDIADQAIIVRRACRVKLPDAIIAATAIVHNMTLLSRNESDFSKIPGLNYINPFNK